MVAQLAGQEKGYIPVCLLLPFDEHGVHLYLLMVFCPCSHLRELILVISHMISILYGFYIVTDVPRGSGKHVRFTEEAAIQDLRERAEKILAIRESEELAEEAIRLGRMVSSNAPLY